MENSFNKKPKNGNDTKMKTGSEFLSRLHSIDKPTLVFDGATGTSLQNLDLEIEDFGGPNYEGCNEYLVITSPKSVISVHNQFLDAGADVIETNTFGANSIVLSEYGLEDKTYELNLIAAQLAKSRADFYSERGKKTIYCWLHWSYN